MSASLTINNQQVIFEVTERKGQSVSFILNGKAYCFSGHPLPDGAFVLDQEIAAHSWKRLVGYGFSAGKAGYKLQLGAFDAVVSESGAQQAGGGTAAARLAPLAPMPGMVRQVLVSEGERVAAGQALLVLEAMKLQLTLSAGGDAQVEALLVVAGQMVGEGAELVRLAPLSAEEAA